MKKILLLIFSLFIAITAFARDYSYLNPPRIAVMDFINNTGTEQSGGEQDALILNTHNNEWGQILSQALLSVLIQANNYHYYDPEKINKIDEFPAADFPLLKIMDKKYVEEALDSAKYSAGDYYREYKDFFPVGDLDFLVIGNVFEGADNKIASTIRILNLARGEEVFTYDYAVEKDFSNVLEESSKIALNIIGDIIKNQKSRVRIAVPYSLAVNNQVGQKEQNLQNGDRPFPIKLFLRPKQVINNENIIENANDTHYFEIVMDKKQQGSYFYSHLMSFLPGQYELLAYNSLKDSIRKYDITLKARDFHNQVIKEEDFRSKLSTLVINDVLPTENFTLYLSEKKQSLKYFWEIARQKNRNKKSARFLFKSGMIDNISIDGLVSINPFYDSYNNQLVIEGIIPSHYELRLVKGSKLSISGVSGIQKYSIDTVRSPGIIDVDLNRTRKYSVSYSRFSNTKERLRESGQVQKVKVSFLLNPAFNSKTIKMYLDDSNNYLLFKDTQKVVFEELYLKSEWEKAAFDYLKYRFEMEGFQAISGKLNKLEIEENPDHIIIINFNEKGPLKAAEQAPVGASFSKASVENSSSSSKSIYSSTGTDREVYGGQTSVQKRAALEKAPSKQRRSIKTSSELGLGFCFGAGGRAYTDYIEKNNDFNGFIAANINFRKTDTFAFGLESAFSFGKMNTKLEDPASGQSVEGPSDINFGGKFGMRWIWGNYKDSFGMGFGLGLALDRDFPGPYLGLKAYLKSFYLSADFAVHPYAILEKGIILKPAVGFGYSFGK